MGIFLLILKIIGIVILAILLFVLALLCIALFVPVRYKFNANYYKKNPDVKVNVSFLLHIVSVKLQIKKDLKKCVIRIFGIPIMDIFKPKEKKAKRQRKKELNQKSQSIQDAKTDHKANNIQDAKTDHKANNIQDTKTDHEANNIQDIKTDHNAINIEDFLIKDNNQESIDSEDSTDFEEKSQEKKNLFDKISELKNKITILFSKTKDKANSFVDNMQSTKDKAENIKEKAEKWITVLSSEKTQKAILKGKTLLIKLLKKILPRKWNAIVHFGMKDPATTGQILGYYWMFIGLFVNHLTVFPDFENEIIEGEIKGKGHIQVITFVNVGLKVLFDPDFKYLRNIKKEVDSL